ncbi:hypothetical protein BCR43DRAFT_407707, partial [Syncephalastrum racemosum]
RPPSHQNKPPSPLGGLCVGERVAVDSMNIVGTLRFIGTTQFKDGVWAGIQLDIDGTGKNDGSVNGANTTKQAQSQRPASVRTSTPDQAIMRLQQLQVKVEVLEAENRYLKLENAQNKTAEQILERSEEYEKIKRELNLSKESLARETAIVEDYKKRTEGLEQSVDELKRAGMESIELYESSVELHRVDMEAINASLMDERRKVAQLESEREGLRKAGLEAVETYEATIEELRKESSTEVWESERKRLMDNAEAHQAALQHTKAHERQVTSLNRDIAELESLIESKIFKESDLEEALEKERKQSARMRDELNDLRDQVKQLTHKSALTSSSNSTASSGSH